MSYKKFEFAEGNGLLNELIRGYSSGSSTRKLAESSGVHQTTVARWLGELGLDKRICRKSGHKFNTSFFKNIDSESKAYFLGIIATDGCVFRPRGKMKSWLLVLKMKDRDVVEKFAKEIGWTGTPTMSRTCGREYRRIALPSDELCLDLMKKGVGEKKTIHLKSVTGVPDKFKRHFWRGAIDGDGGLGEYEKGKALNLVGTKEFVDEFRKYVGSVCKSRAKIRCVKRGKTVDLYSLKVNGCFAAKVCEEIYSGASIYMERKQRIAESWMNDAKEVISDAGAL
jgi:hypothetical protein